MLYITVDTKVIPLRIYIGVVLYKANTSIYIGICAKVIGLTIELNPHTSVETGAVAISGTGCVNNPSTLGYTILIECILDTIYSLLTNIKIVIGTREAVTTFSILPTCLKGTVDGVVKVAVHLEDTCAGGINLAAALVGTNELAVYDFVVVSNLDLGNNSTKVYYRLTSLAVGSVLVTCLGCGSFLIEYKELCIVNVVGRRDGCKLGCNVDRACEGLAVYNAIYNITNNVYNGLVAH